MKYLIGFIVGVLFVISPDLASLYSDRVSYSYKKAGCEGLSPNECFFNKNNWYDNYTKDHPILTKIHYYFILGEGPIYWTLSGRCSKQIFYNPSATKDSGKITKREYFYDRSSKFMKEASNLIFNERED